MIFNHGKGDRGMGTQFKVSKQNSILNLKATFDRTCIHFLEGATSTFFKIQPE